MDVTPRDRLMDRVEHRLFDGVDIVAGREGRLDSEVIPRAESLHRPAEVEPPRTREPDDQRVGVAGLVALGKEQARGLPRRRA